MCCENQRIPAYAGMTVASENGSSIVAPAQAGIQGLQMLLNIRLNLIPMLFQPGAPCSRFAFAHQHGESIF